MRLDQIKQPAKQNAATLKQRLRFLGITRSLIVNPYGNT